MIGKSPRPQSRSSAMGKSSAPSKSPRPAPRPADLKETNTLMRAMGGADAKATKQDLKAARQDRMSKSSAPSKSPRPMRSPVKKAGGGMVGYKDGGCVMAGRGGKYKGSM
jgi:hypothetical protein